ncbi:S-layer protein [Hydrococcus rivularis NIES-593]|uniref:S-layer protein n=1 Tax=Hydrococcus rivularis NIES-593 TaxID=1921803 RepID=A0A1U7HJJ8_9CYAN|nr:S-layer homology domain-containing protein [Hydrococcus rivularis]OKH23762.1 S-layer protein [Hydrococcus rivularis NIES-593]
MSKSNPLQATTALFLTFSLTSGTTISFAFQVPTLAQNNRFSDVSRNYWATNFIDELVQRQIIAGFPDGTFQPDAPVTRAQFAAMVTKAFQRSNVRSAASFVDVPANYWANSAINTSYRMGFLSGYPGRVFQPDRNIPREQVLVSLANGLNYRANDNVTTLLETYSDRDRISNFALAPIAAATQERLVVNYPTLSQLNPSRNATRAEVAAFIYQALVREGKASPLQSPYIVARDFDAIDESAAVVRAGTKIPVSYEQEKIILKSDEKLDATLTVAKNIKAADGTTAIPAGSKIAGELRPTDGGTRFVAKELILSDGTTYDIEATSGIVTEKATVRKGTDVGTLATNAAIGAAAAAAIAAITGDKDIATEEIVIGAGAGVLASLIPMFFGMNKVDLIVVEPEQDLRLTLREDLILE